MKKLLSNINNDFKVSNYIYIGLFSILASKSIFLNPFTKLQGILGILFGFVLVILIFIVSVFALYYLKKLGWKAQDTKVKKTRILLYMGPGLVVSGVLWMCYWPAIIPFDSAWIWGLVSANEYNNLHPIVYIMYVKLMRMLWDSPKIFVLIQIIYCSFVYAYVGYVFETHGLKKRWVWAVVCLLALLPVNAIHSVTMLKDIPYIMGLIFISVLLFDYTTNNKISIKKIIILIVASLIALFARHNAMLTIPLTLVFTAFLYLLNKNIKQVLVFGVALIIILGIFFGTQKAVVISVKGRYYHKPSKDGAITIPSAQIAYIVSTNWHELTDKQMEDANYFVDTDYLGYIKNQTPERWAYNFNFYACMREENIAVASNRFVNFYLDLIRSYTKSAIDEYENMTAIVWAIPNKGYTVCRNVGIAEYGKYKSENPNSLLPELKNILDKTILNPKNNVKFLWRPALPLLLSLLLIVIALKRHKKLSLLVIAPALFNALGYMMVCPSQNVRYLYCNASIFIIFSVYTFMLPKQDENAEGYLQETND